MSARPDPQPQLDDSELVDALEASRRLGMLSKAPIAGVIGHSAAFLAPLTPVTGTVVDLGSGGGIPGLVIAWMRPDLRVVLVDRRTTRTDHLHRLVNRLHLHDRVTVVTADASALPRHCDDLADAVVARSFGPPETVLRAALPILAADGLIVVSAPPSDPQLRWTPALLARHGVHQVASGSRVVVLTR